MSITVSQVSNSQSFGVWLQRTNQIAQIISSNTVTTDYSTTGSITVGNSYLQGYLGVNTLNVANNLGGGIINVPATLSVFTNTQFTNTVVGGVYSYINPVNVYFNPSNSVAVNTSILFVSAPTVNCVSNLISITGNVNIANNVTITTNTQTANLIVTSNATTNTLNVQNLSSLNTVNVSNNITVGNNVVVTANVSANNLVIASNTTSGTLNVSGLTSLSNVNISATANVVAVNVTGAITANNLTVSSNTVLNVLQASNTVSNNLTISSNTVVSSLTANTANVAFDVIVGRNLYVNGNTVTSGSQAANGNIIPVLSNTFFVGNTTNRFIVYGSSGTFNNLTLDNGGVSSTTYSVANTSQQIIDTFSKTIYRSASYLIQMSDGTNYHLTNVMLIHDGTVPYITEYGTVLSNITLGLIDATINAGNVNLLVTPTNTSVVVKMVRTTINV